MRLEYTFWGPVAVYWLHAIVRYNIGIRDGGSPSEVAKRRSTISPPPSSVMALSRLSTVGPLILLHYDT